ncbi:MAG TPA: phosphoribosylanthranilate isomerase [Gemmatimonadaceae bacterium]|nr:phosphoribosylanthranilate isomerase [Gemmatimonadaceae bacterium]
MIRVRVKVCCIGSIQEARIAVQAGADAVGLVSSMPSGPGVISEDSIRTIAATVPPPIATFLLTCHQRLEDIVAQQQRCGTNTVQLCDRLVEGSHPELRAAMPGISVVQVIHVNGRESVDEAIEIAPHVDALLLDSGNQKLATKELGGTGRTHDWGLSAEIRRRARAPVFLAGGLRAENVRDAISQVEPWGVDICSGVRTDGRLDQSKLDGFILQLSQRR